MAKIYSTRSSGPKFPGTATPEYVRRRRTSESDVWDFLTACRVFFCLSRYVRLGFIFRRTSDEGDRHPLGSGRISIRHCPSAFKGIREASAACESHRLAGCLICDESMAAGFCISNPIQRRPPYSSRRPGTRYCALDSGISSNQGSNSQYSGCVAV